MSSQRTYREKVLIVDDQPLTQELLAYNLEAAGYQCETADDGEQAWNTLQASAGSLSLVLLDIKMPKLDGFGLLKRIRSDDKLAHLPVIVHTAIDDSESVAEGIRQGAYYFLTKPFNRERLLAIVRDAIETYHKVEPDIQHSDQRGQLGPMLNNAQFSFKTLDEARLLAQQLSDIHPKAHGMLLGLSELFINAIEHGNLGIGYDIKTQLVQDAKWEEEINRRCSLNENCHKQVRVNVLLTATKIEVLIRDEGQGFNWKDYLEISTDRAFDPHGRGIAISKIKSFDNIQYLGCGNEVVVTKHF